METLFYVYPYIGDISILNNTITTMYFLKILVKFCILCTILIMSFFIKCVINTEQIDKIKTFISIHHFTIT